MSSRTFALAFLASSIWIAPFGHSIETVSRQQQPNQCRVTVAAVDKPDLLPEHARWESAFRGETGGITALTGVIASLEGRQRVAARASEAITKVEALGRSVAPAPAGGLAAAGEDRDALKAEVLIDSRDTLTRELNNDDFDRLSQQVDEMSATLAVSLPVPGVIKTQPDGSVLCEAAVTGRDRPYLIPEYKVWESFFDTWAGAAALNRLDDGGFKDSYVALLGQRTLRMAATDIRSFLMIATATSDAIRVARQSASPLASRDAAMHLRGVVMRGRQQLVRSMTPEGWRTLLQRLDGSRAAAKWWYRSPV